MIRRLTLWSFLFALTLVGLAFARSSEQTWTGEISDSACKFEHEAAEGQPVPPAPECVKVCLRGGSKYVFVVEDKLYTIENQTFPGLDKQAGIAVKLTGELKGDSITITKIEAVAP